MSTPETTETQQRVEPTAEPSWWHQSHPTFAAITGFFAGMLFVTALPGGFAGVLRLLFPYERAQDLFPLVLIALVLPIVLLAKRKTRRFGDLHGDRDGRSPRWWSSGWPRWSSTSWSSTT